MNIIYRERTNRKLWSFEARWELVGGIQRGAMKIDGWEVKSERERESGELWCNTTTTLNHSLLS